MKHKCTFCGKKKDLSDSVIHSSYVKKDGSVIRLYACKKCNNTSSKKYYKSLTGKKKKDFIYRANEWNRSKKGQAWRKKYAKSKSR